MGIELRHTNPSGIWSGHFWLGDGDNDAVAFSAWITIEHGRLKGSILEPALFCGMEKGLEHESTIRGHFSEDEVVFLKTYKAFEHEPAYYEGALSDCGHQIRGRWYFGWPDEVSGRFEMAFKTAHAKSDSRQQAGARSFD